MPLILQIETSTEVCSVALCQNGSLLYLAESDEQNSHTEKLTLLIEHCMQQAGYTYHQLDAIALSDGPGSYTSLRIGAATAKGICYTTDKPLITFDSLKILAHGVEVSCLNKDDIIIPMIDARRMEVYTAIYDANYSNVVETHAHILDEHTFVDYKCTKHLCGSGVEKFIKAYPSDLFKIHHTKTSASFMNKLSLDAFNNSQFSDVAYFTPEYFKAPNITKSTKKIF